MGYTRYWERTNKPYDEEFINQVQQIINRCTSLGISIKDGFGEGNPEKRQPGACGLRDGAAQGDA